MMKYHIKIKDKVVHRTNNLKEALQAIKTLYTRGHTDIYLYGGRIGKWWKGVN